MASSRLAAHYHNGSSFACFFYELRLNFLFCVVYYFSVSLLGAILHISDIARISRTKLGVFSETDFSRKFKTALQKFQTDLVAVCHLHRNSVMFQLIAWVLYAIQLLIGTILLKKDMVVDSFFMHLLLACQKLRKFTFKRNCN